MTRTGEPAVSVVIPAYNAAWCVRRAVDSVLAQTFGDFELIVVDDGSTDDTPALLAGYGDALRVIRKKNGGLSSARNRGIEAAAGRYVAFLDADDRWLPAKLERQVALLEAQPNLTFCSTAARVESREGEPLGEWRCRGSEMPAVEAIFETNAFVAGSGSAVVARREVLLRLGGFDEALSSLEDVDMWMRLAADGGYACLDEPLTVIVKHPESMSGDLGVMRSAAITVMRKNRHLLPRGRRGSFWRKAYAGMLSDYAKWAWRVQRRAQAVGDLVIALAMAPFARGRLVAGLFLAMLRNRCI